MQAYKRMFFICGGRVWPAILAHIIGGPCSIGKLTLLTPSAKVEHKGQRFISQYELDCKDDFEPWSFGKRFLASLFLPQLSSAVVLK